MEGAGVDYAIVVHPEPYRDDHLEHCLPVEEICLKSLTRDPAGRYKLPATWKSPG
jgi:hypothetical protein